MEGRRTEPPIFWSVARRLIHWATTAGRRKQRFLKYEPFSRPSEMIFWLCAVVGGRAKRAALFFLHFGLVRHERPFGIAQIYPNDQVLGITVKILRWAYAGVLASSRDPVHV